MAGSADSDEYGVVINPKMYTTTTGNPEYLIATMKGASSARMSKTSEAMTFKDSLTKQIVDSEEGLQARIVKGKESKFPLVRTAMMTTSEIRRIVATDKRIWRRTCLVKFDRIFDAPEQDRQLG